MHYRILTPNELDLSFPAPNDRAKFHQILFKIATAWACDDRHTDSDTSFLWSLAWLSEFSPTAL